MHLFLPLLILTDAVAFFVGVCVGIRLCDFFLRKRERAVAIDRKWLNNIWQHLYRTQGIRKPGWVKHILDDEEWRKK